MHANETKREKRERERTNKLGEVAVTKARIGNNKKCRQRYQPGKPHRNEMSVVDTDLIADAKKPSQQPSKSRRTLHLIDFAIERRTNRVYIG